MVSYHPAMFGGYRPCGDRDIILLVVEEWDPTGSCLDLLLLFIPPCLKHMVWKYTAYHVYKSDIGHAPKTEIKENYTNSFFQSILKHWREGER